MTLPDELVVIARWQSDDSTEITLQDFVIGGRSVIPLFSDRAAFDAQIAGSGFEKQGVVVQRAFLHYILRGAEALLLDSGGGAIALTKEDLT